MEPGGDVSLKEGIVPDNGGAQPVDPGFLPSTMLIDMVELGHGCVGDCLSCGAFEGIDSEDRKVVPISIKQLEANITREIQDQRTGTRFRLVDLFRRYVTAGVNMEPLASGIFNQAAALINSFSGGKSKLVAISHGLSCVERIVKKGGSPATTYTVPLFQLENLRELNELMLRDVVPLFVLSMDSARKRGTPSQTATEYQDQIRALEKPDTIFSKILNVRATEDQTNAGIQKFGENAAQWEARKSKVKHDLMAAVRQKINAGEELGYYEKIIARYVEAWDGRRKSVVEINARGYAQTLNILALAIKAGKRVTISLQGDDNKDSLAYHGLARRILQRTIDLLSEVYGMSTTEVHELFALIYVTPPRLYAGVGRAKNLLGISGGKCSVIPDPGFIDDYMFKGDPYRITRGRIRANGVLEIQAYRAKQTYNDTVAPSEDNPWMVVEPTRDRATVAARVAIDATSMGCKTGASSVAPEIGAVNGKGTK